MLKFQATIGQSCSVSGVKEGVQGLAITPSGIGNGEQISEACRVKSDVAFGLLFVQMVHRSTSEMMGNPTVRAVSGLLRNFSANLPDYNSLLAGHLLQPRHQQQQSVSMPQTARAWQPSDPSTPFKAAAEM